MAYYKIHFSLSDRYVLALKIPVADVSRLSLKPLKWLHYISFAISGAKGDLSTSPGGSVVNYEYITLHPQDYYFTKDGDPSHPSTILSMLTISPYRCISCH
jgi:hypothetical protein